VWLTRLYERFRGLVHEMGKFGVVGAVAYAVDTVIFVALVLTMESLLAKTIATAVAATVAFIGNRFWTWRHRARSGLTREYVLYFTFNGVGLAISLAILGISHYGLGALWPAFQTPLADVVAANVIGLAAATVFRFWSYRTFVFPEPTLRQPGDTAEPTGTPPTPARHEPQWRRVA
jgi:putative flippase GtrA